MNITLLSSITALVTGKSIEDFVKETMEPTYTPYLHRKIVRKGAGKGQRRNCVVWCKDK